jgi:hypothetical protein
MSCNKFSAFLTLLPAPLGLKGEEKIDKITFIKLLKDFRIRSHLINNEGMVYFPEVLWFMTQRVLKMKDKKVLGCD